MQIVAPISWVGKVGGPIKYFFAGTKKMVFRRVQVGIKGLSLNQSFLQPGHWNRSAVRNVLFLSQYDVTYRTDSGDPWSAQRYASSCRWRREPPLAPGLYWTSWDNNWNKGWNGKTVADCQDSCSQWEEKVDKSIDSLIYFSCRLCRHVCSCLFNETLT